MKSLLRWTIRNTPAMNTLMVGIMVVGAFGLMLMHREFFPAFDLEIIQVTVPYPGASPEEVEEGICQKIEEAVRAIDGIKKLSAIAREGSGTVVLELQANVPDVQKVLNEIESEVDRIPSFPELAEDPIIKQITLRRAVIRVGVLGPESDQPDAEVNLRDVTERVRDRLLLLPSISQANIIGAKDFQIDVEISEDTLRKYGLTLRDVARIIRRQNVELPGGTMRTESQEVLLRGKNKQLVGEEIAKLPLVTQPNGVVLTVGDLGVVRDEFIDVAATTRINGRPGLVISIDKTATEDLFAIIGDVEHFIESTEKDDGFRLPHGYEVITWNDMSVMVEDRLNLLTKNGIQGLVLVFLVLSVFLELRLAFWVALGIPISILGGCGVLYWGGETLNMLSMFAFLMALGILVDDAIVIGENVYTHRQRGKGYVEAAVDGTYEVLPSVLAAVTTTIVAFMPLLFVPGIMGKFIAIMPLAVIVMLVFSLTESTFILPCHLAHGPYDAEGNRRGILAKFYRYWTGLPLWWTITLFLAAALVVAAHWLYPQPLPWKIEPFGRSAVAGLAYAALLPAAVISLAHLMYPLKRLGDLFACLNRGSGWLVNGFIRRVYSPMLRLSVNNPLIVISTAVAFLLLSAGLILGGIVPFNAFPKLDVHNVYVELAYPDGTAASVTEEKTKLLEDTIWRIHEEYKAQTGDDLVLVTHRAVGVSDISGEMSPAVKPQGSHAGAVGVELVETSERSLTSAEILALWREKADEFPGVERLTFRTAVIGPGGIAIEFTLLAEPEQMEAMEKAVEQCKAELRKYPGVFDVSDDSRPGKWEFQLKVKDQAKAMGIPLAELAETVRASYYGEEVMRLQRGRHEVKLMVRYPRHERRSLANFDDIRVRTPFPVAEMIQRAIQQNANGGGSRGSDTALGSPERPLTELADVEIRRGYSAIMRQDQLRAITVTADVDEGRANAQDIINDLKSTFLPNLLRQLEYRGIQVRWEGQQEQTDESIAGLQQGLVVALLAMFALLTLKFRSYVQPVLILLIIPFGVIGAVVGHWIMSLEVTLLSLFGVVALTGIVVNDSIVLIDFINTRVRAGVPLKEALLDAGPRRFRAVLCTSLTTIAGLSPLLLERSLQAQILIPMATSICFGLMFTTVLVLVLVPVLYLVYARMLPEAGAATTASTIEPPSDSVDQDEHVEMIGY
ncbi:MAG: efflux RND transporter permease subunit [Planctomycetota bacterium]|jgi:multidrug efflux pump subunit AcrB